MSDDDFDRTEAVRKIGYWFGPPLVEDAEPLMREVLERAERLSDRPATERLVHTPEGVYVWGHPGDRIWGLPIVDTNILVAPKPPRWKRRLLLRRLLRRRGARERTYRVRKKR